MAASMCLTLPEQSGCERFDPASVPDAEADAGWMISFVDILMLLLTLFVLLLAFHASRQPETAEKPKAVKVLASAKPAPAPADVVREEPTPPAPPPEKPSPVIHAPVLPEKPGPATQAPSLPEPFSALANAQSTASLLRALQPPAADAKPQSQPAPTASVPEVQPASASAPVPAIVVPPEVRDHVEVAVSADAVNLIIKDDVLFDPASAELKPDSHRVLDGVVTILNQNEYAVSVEGHTDDRPIHSARYPSNWDLSVARATGVTRYLIEHGIARQRLRAVGYADTRPLDPARTAEARARNRRVSLVVHVRKAQSTANQSGGRPSVPDTAAIQTGCCE